MMVLTLPLNDLSNYWSTLTHSFFDTNITLFPYWKVGPRGQLVVNPLIANFVAYHVHPCQIQSLGD